MSQNYQFGRFEVCPPERSLFIDGVRVELGSRAFDVLQTLVKARDRVVTKDELLEVVWPGLVVEENNLQVQVSTLRKLLGAKAISTIQGRGYQFSLMETGSVDQQVPELPPAVEPEPRTGRPLAAASSRQLVLAKAPLSTLTAAERTAVLGGYSPVTTNTPPQSIAVLPFANLTGDASEEYFSDGLADQLLSVLAKIKGLRVIARTSSFSFKGKNQDIATIGNRLGVAHIVEGSVRKNGNHVRIFVQLVKVASSSQVWSEVYDRTFDDIFVVQDDITQFVLAELRANLLNRSHRRIELRGVELEVATAAKSRSINTEAHRLYLQARFLMSRHSGKDVLNCIDYLRQAVAIDPEYSLAWAALSHALVTAIDITSATAPVNSAVEALASVKRALAIDPDLVEGHVAMCTYQTMHAWDWRGAEASVQRALHLAPDDVGALKEAARLYYALGRSQEALGYATRAIAIDPLNSICYWYLASSLGVLGRNHEAETAIRKAIELSPDAPSLHFRLAFLLDLQGRHDEALVEAAREQAGWGRLFALGILHFRSGNIVESDLALNSLVDGFAEISPVHIAMNYCVRGDADRAFEWLDRAYRHRDTGLSYVKSGWLKHPVQMNPRWPAFLKKMGFDE